MCKYLFTNCKQAREKTCILRTLHTYRQYLFLTKTYKVLDTLLITSDESIGPCVVIMLMIQIMFTVHAWVQLLNGPLRVADEVTGSLAPGTGTACPMNHYHFHPKQTLMQ